MAATPLQLFWVYVKLLGLNDQEVIKVLAPLNATSFKELSAEVQIALVDYLKMEWSSRCKRPRGAIIHYLCIMPGYDFKTPSGKPNYEMIDEWVKGKMKGKPLNKLSLSELNTVVTMVKQWYQKQVKK